jgi:hypothetical protein
MCAFCNQCGQDKSAGIHQVRNEYLLKEAAKYYSFVLQEVDRAKARKSERNDHLLSDAF